MSNFIELDGKEFELLLKSGIEYNLDLDLFIQYKDEVFPCYFSKENFITFSTLLLKNKRKELLCKLQKKD